VSESASLTAPGPAMPGPAASMPSSFLAAAWVQRHFAGSRMEAVSEPTAHLPPSNSGERAGEWQKDKNADEEKAAETRRRKASGMQREERM